MQHDSCQDILLHDRFEKSGAAYLPFLSLKARHAPTFNPLAPAPRIGRACPGNQMLSWRQLSGALVFNPLNAL
ncbi:hypothetical protein PAXRUDRAFT_827270 [Paxillus rubicundulus Ve08.2h10]|uniref:Uncharacterized protein n=1 Tax=Paxillus rubicundulus Ve08.2h10 TaxID=930991 RepID=A0A0D0DY69_9AGAM|nr:hypothetical protein PAXRUDRAFT_827270 [Paxillus rubicundulus Ve08.2h10]